MTEERPATPPPPPPPPREEQRLHDFEDSPPRRFNRTFRRATAERFFVLSRERCDEWDCPQEEFELAGSRGNVYTIRIGRDVIWREIHGGSGVTIEEEGTGTLNKADNTGSFENKDYNTYHLL
ncbi:hypothetical protein MY8738_000158 [Beauveria namnaoensis]